MAFTRRALLGTAAAFAAGPAFARRRPKILGVMSGDIHRTGGVIWAQADRPGRMIVEVARSERFRDVMRVEGPAALASNGFTSRIRLVGRPSGEPVFYRVRFLDLGDLKTRSAPLAGRFKTAPADASRPVTIGFGGDVAGQGWGVRPDRQSMTTFASMTNEPLDAFIHSGDMVYADGPLKKSVPLGEGRVWRNIVTPAKSKVAETLEEFRGQYSYNFLDLHYRRFMQNTPLLVQWDDHETRNNWYPTRRLTDDDRYTEKSCALLAARAKRAFFDMNPIWPDEGDPERIYRRFSFGPLLDVFMIDGRSYRGPNNAPNNKNFLGAQQLRWLKSQLAASKATWKLIASNLPIGLIVTDGPKNFEGVANGDGPPRGREIEIADLLKFIGSRKIRNTVWVTADVHYAAAHRFAPAMCPPFWEFVAGPLHAGTYGPNDLDNTFKPQSMFIGIPPNMKPNRSPAEPYQFYGKARIDPKTKIMQVSLHNTFGKQVFAKALEPAR